MNPTKKNEPRAPEPIYAVCQNGVFNIPEELVASLEAYSPRRIVYLRNDEDSVTISTSVLTDGRRRQLTNHYRVPMFRGVTRVAIIDLKESLRVMPVEWR